MKNTIKIQHKPQLNYINYFRAIAIIIIVLGHTVCWGVKGSFICETNTFIFKGGTFIFIFIAGFLFQYLSYKFNYLDYIKKKFLYVVLPYIFCIMPIAILYTLTNINSKIPFSFLSKPIKFISTVIFGLVLSNPMWFVGMIVIFFIAAPIFLYIKNKKILWYLLLFTGILLTIFTKRPSVGSAIYHQTDFSLFALYLSFIKLYFQSFLFFLSSYLLGMELCSLTEKYFELIEKNIKKVLLISFCLFAFTYISFISTDFNYISNNLGHFFFIITLLALCLFYENKISNKPILSKLLNLLATNSFGIFFIHQYFINLMIFHSLYDTFQTPYFDINQNTLKCCIYTWGMFFISLTGSLLVLWILKNILIKVGVKNTRKFIGT